MSRASRYLVAGRLYAGLVATVALLTGCGGVQSALDPAGPQAARISDLWWLMFAVCTAVFVAVIGVLLYAVLLARERPNAATPEAERRRAVAVGGAVAATVVILFVLLIASIAAGRGLTASPAAPAVTIEVAGHQWWWQVHYVDADPSRRVITANEIHIPVGQPIVFRLTSRDVIHSFWVPNLHGKRDLIPGHVTTIALQADRPGVYRGQCAEFCGYQHAHMALLVVAEPPEQFAAWLEGQRRPGAEPNDARQQRGQEVFLTSSCVMCHTIRGTPAGGKVAPDLTHLASRRTIAAGMLPNTPGHLAGWILDPQHIKPGSNMPATALNGDDLQALLAYLERLK
jgi:cytochrome c oxidase subunit 2